jgi:hypothetical protein
VEGERRVIVVLGMHRSGTSLLSGLLHAAGAASFGTRLMAADQHNETGYWEHVDVFRVHEALLADLDRSWTGAGGTLPMPEGWNRTPAAGRARAALEPVLRDEIAAAAPAAWGVKDPRLSRLWPLWDDLLRDLPVAPSVLLAVRRPGAVADSIVRRDALSRVRIELLWLLHNLEAVRHAGPRLRAVVDYDGWFTDPAGQADAMASALGLGEEGRARLRDAAAGQVRPGLRHHQTETKPSLPWVGATYDLLRRMAAEGVSEDLRDQLLAIDRSVEHSFTVWNAGRDGAGPATQAGTTSVRLLDLLDEATLEPAGPTGDRAVWHVTLDGAAAPALLLHPPARLRFTLPGAGRARLRFAVAIHPDAWRHGDGGGCRFLVSAGTDPVYSIVLDPASNPDEARWHSCTIDLPAVPGGRRTLTLETRAIGNGHAYRWALWRDPIVDWT